MAQFPRSQRRVSASGIQAPFRQKQANTDYARALQQTGAAVTQAGEAVAEIDRKITQIERTRKTSDAQIKIQKTINNYRLKFAEDQNSDNWQGYYDGLESDVQAIVGDIEDPVVKQEMASDAANRTNAAVFGMKTTAVGRNVAKSRGNVEILKQASIESVDTNKEGIISDARDTFTQAVLRQAELENLPDTWVQQQLTDRDKKAAERWLYNIANDDPAHAKDMLEQMDQFSGEEKTKLEKSFTELEKTKKQDDKLRVQKVQKDNQNGFMQTYYNGMETGTIDRASLLNEIRLARANNLVTSGFASQFEKILKVPIGKSSSYSPDTHIEAYTKWAEVDEKDLVELQELQTWLTSVTGNGLDVSTSKKLATLIAEAKQTATDKFYFRSIYDSLAKFLKDNFTKAPIEAFMPKTFADRVFDEGVTNNPKRMQEIADEVVTQTNYMRNNKKVTAGDADFNTVGGIDVSKLRTEAQKQNKAVVVSIKNGKVVATGLTNRRSQ